MAKIPGMNVDEPVDDGCLPDGHYPFEVVDSEYVERVYGQGHKFEGQTYSYIKLTFDGIDGTPSQGVRIWCNYNWINPTASAVAMGKRAFQELCIACGLGGTVDDTNLLHGRRFIGEVYTEPASNGFGPKNQFNSYQSPTSGAATGAPPPPAPAHQPPGPPSAQQQAPPPQQGYQTQAQPPGWTGNQPATGGAPPQQQAPQQQQHYQQPAQPPAQQQFQQPPQQPGMPPAAPEEPPVWDQ